MKTISFFAAALLSLSVLTSSEAVAQENKTPKKVTITFKNNSILPRKYTFIYYRATNRWTKDRSNNATEGVVLAPYATKTLTDVVGAELFLANSRQVDVVMSGKSIVVCHFTATP